MHTETRYSASRTPPARVSGEKMRAEKSVHGLRKYVQSWQNISGMLHQLVQICIGPAFPPLLSKKCLHMTVALVLRHEEVTDSSQQGDAALKLPARLAFRTRLVHPITSCFRDYSKHTVALPLSNDLQNCIMSLVLPPGQSALWAPQTKALTCRWVSSLNACM